jgi:hypothetical protein
MISFETTYEINNGQGWIIFKSDGPDTVSAEYNRGTIKGSWDGEKLKGQFVDTISKGEGRIEIVFHKNGFDAKWKAGLDEGPMKGKWVGKIEIQSLKKMRQLSALYFEELIGLVDVLSFHLDNTYEAIEENGGEERFKITFDIKNQTLQPAQSYSEIDEKDNKILYYSGSPYIEFYDDYISNSNFEFPGYCLITGNDNWEIPFHGQLEEVAYGELEEETYLKMKQAITPNSLYRFFSDVFSFLHA